MKKKLLKILKEVLPFIVGLILILFFFRNNLFNGAVNFNPHVGTNDYMDYYIPVRDLMNDSYKEGKLPIWTSKISGGYPFLAANIGGLYPVNYLLKDLEPQQSYALVLAFHYLLIFSFSYLFLREINLSKTASLFGGVIATFSGFSANEIMHIGMLTSFAYFLGIIYLIEKYIRKQKFYLIILAGIFLGLSILGGHPQIIIYSLLFIYPYALIRWASVGNKYPKLFLSLLLFSLVGLGIGAGQLLPQYEFTNSSTRSGGLTSEEILHYSFPLSDIKSFWDPFGSYSVDNTINGFAQNGWPTDERYVYPSILGLIFFFAGVYFARKKDYFSVIFTVIFTVSFIFAAGGQLGGGVFFSIPPISFFRIPYRIIFVTNFSIAVLGALAIDKLRSWDIKDKFNNRSKLLLVALIILISYSDLYHHAKKLYPEVDGGVWYQENETVMYLKENLQKNERVVNLPYFNASIPVYIKDQKMWTDPEFHKNLRNLLPVYNNLLYDIPKNVGAANSGTLKIERFNDLESEIFFNGWEYDPEGKLTGVSDTFLFLNRIMGVRYVLTNQPFNSFVTVPAKTIEFENGQDPLYIIEFFDYFPRQFMVPRAEKAGPDEILEHFEKVDFEPLQKIYIEEDTDWGAKGGFSATSEFLKYEDTEVVIKTQAAGDGFLFLSDTFYPGWKAYVDGQEKKIYRANYAFRAVEVPSGEHEVVFRYEPESVKLGINVSIGTSIFAGIIFVTALIREWKFTKNRSNPEISEKESLTT
ncbi:YfhO family protein [Candidatus Woesebacteria bacterium]|nr:YfhO family protein [Candidatus Woesebacteria bacterium]